MMAFKHFDRLKVGIYANLNERSGCGILDVKHIDDNDGENDDLID